jgi:nucleotide-binding universal stress UspA family protein
MKALIAYDGSLNSKKALEYGIRKVKETGGQLIVLHVFNSGLFIGYDASPNAERMARIESARFVEDARSMLDGTGPGLRSEIVVMEGNPADEVVRYAVAEHVDIIFAPPSGKAIVKNSPCPVSIVPGCILVPLDNTDVSTHTLERIRQEAKETASKVILLGIVPVHIYTKWEKKELEKVKHDTSVVLKKVKKWLNENDTQTTEILRSGYPDEEITRVAGDHPVTMIVIPAEGNEPSELTKAAAILSDRESGPANRSFVLVTP